MEKIQIQSGLPDAYRLEAAEVYYAAFQQKFEPIMGSTKSAINILAKSFDKDYALIALYEGRLAGLCGLHDADGQFVDFELPHFTDEFGHVKGLLKLLLFLPFASKSQPGELLLDEIAVHKDMRGQGIGTKLLTAVFDLAQEKGLQTVRLSVVDTNPAAYRLYARLGFEATKTEHVPFLKNVMGFSAATTMIKRIDSNV